MGFSSQVQSKAVHEALLARQDAELRLLDTMRRAIASKVKADKEYSQSLTALSASGLKGEARGEEGSLLARAWRGMMEELENAARLLRANADAIERDTLDKLNTLAQEKRKARKHYLDDYTRINQQLSNVCDEVARKKGDYQKHLEFYKVMRAKFEEHYIKSGRVGKKLDDVRDKYQRACRRLHLVHNEYVLLLSEAEQVQRDVRTCLLPALMHHQQATLQAFLLNWRSILKELSLNWNFTSKPFMEVCARSEALVDTIVPSSEYSDFLLKQTLATDASCNGTTIKTAPSNCKGSLPLEMVDFSFDNSLVEDSSGKLLANTLAVDNLTVEWVRAKMSEVEPKLRECQEKLSNKNTHLQELSEVGLAELKCEEKKLVRQLELIKKALTELGCEEVPQGCDIPIDSSFESTTPEISIECPSKRPSLPSPSPPPPPPLQATSSLVDMLRKPFRRKSVPSSPQSSRHNLYSSKAAYLFGGQSFWSLGHIHLPKTSLRRKSKSLLSSSRTLVDEEWFHGVLPREEVVRLLTKEGDFLVRETTRNDENQTVLSVCWGGHKHFIVQTTAEGQYRFEGPAFDTIQELIMFQYKSGLPVTGRSGAILRQPIPRERWELNNDDVILLDKIGRGNFGDVHKGRLRGSDQEVAVKTCRVTVAEEHKRKFLQEGRILKQYDHPNVVKLIGICVQKQPIMIVMELVKGGSLLTFLRNNASTLSVKQLVLMCRDAAAGMCYLESKNCIHRDLAARNCLVGDGNAVKISDFGMSREEEEYIVSDGMKQIPIKWTAPEALNFGKYTSLCDVWSYGVLCWEVFAKGGTPYPGLSNSKARERIDAGYRMPAPEGTPDEMYMLMLQCWEYQPENRPHFEQIHKILDKIYANLR